MLNSIDKIKRLCYNGVISLRTEKQPLEKLRTLPPSKVAVRNNVCYRPKAGKGYIMTKYFGFALADSMFNGDYTIVRKALTADEVKAMVKELTPCLNPSHKATIDAMQARFGIEVEIPEQPPRVSVGIGDSVVVMGVRGLPRLTDRHEYTEEEIAAATFSFSMYTVIE